MSKPNSKVIFTIALTITGISGMGIGVATVSAPLAVAGAALTIAAGLLMPHLVIGLGLFFTLHSSLLLLAIGQPSAAWQIVATMGQNVAMLLVFSLPFAILTGYALGIAGRFKTDA